MFWIVFTAIVGLVWGGCLVAFIGTANKDNRFMAGAIGAVALVVWACVTVGMSIHRVGQRQVGIVYNFSGTITGKVDPGLAWTAPYQHIAKENVGLQKEEFVLGKDNAAVSRDQQPIFADVQLNYQVEPQQVVELYKTVGPQWKSILLEGRMLQVFKNVTAAYTAAETTSKRPELRTATKAAMTAELAPYDIKVVDVLVKNLGYTDSYRAAINEKNIQVQQSLRAEAKVAQSRAEAEQEVAKAEGDAKAIALKGRALRENPEILQLEAIDKLNPNATVVICTGTGSGNCPSFLPQAAVNGGGK